MLGWVEIQNVSSYVVDTSGWVVAVHNGRDQEPDDPEQNIDGVHEKLWHLPNTMDIGEVLYKDDSNSREFDIWWRADQGGWAMIVDDEGNLVDFAVFGDASYGSALSENV